MIDELKKIPVFIVRDFKILFTYKIAFSMTFLSLIFTLFHLVLFGSMFKDASLTGISLYGGNFISYILVGSIGWGFLWSIMSTIADSLRSEMMMGTLESLLLTSTKTLTIMLSYALFGCFFGLLMIAILLGVGFFIFDISLFSSASIFTWIIFGLSAVMMTGFGLIMGGLTIWVKNIGDTVPLIQNIVMFFCGVYFPISVLPDFLQPVSTFMPFYYSIEGLRRSLISTTTTSEMLFYVGVISAISIVVIIVGITVLHFGLIKAKKDGSLSYY